jgi:hypothetical protein
LRSRPGCEFGRRPAAKISRRHFTRYSQWGGAETRKRGHLRYKVGALAAGEHGRVEGKRAEQVERVGIRPARLGGDLLEINNEVAVNDHFLPYFAFVVFIFFCGFDFDDCRSPVFSFGSQSKLEFAGIVSGHFDFEN